MSDGDVWERVIELLDDTSDGLALMALVEATDGDELLANGVPSSEAPFPVTQRGFASKIAERMTARWRFSEYEPEGKYTNYLRWTRSESATPEEVAELVRRCSAAGIELTRRDGASLP